MGAGKRAQRPPTTRAVLVLRDAGLEFGEHLYRYEERGGTKVSSRELGVDEHAVIKTLVMQDERSRPLIVLMHGDMSVATKKLAKQLERERVVPCHPEVAERHTGYQVGGTSPFGTRREMPIYAENSIFDLPRVYLNGGRRGFLVSLDPMDLYELLKPELVEVARPR